MPSLAAIWHVSSRGMPRGNTPPVTVCLSLPVGLDGVVCALARTAPAAMAGRKSLRRMDAPIVTGRRAPRYESMSNTGCGMAQVFRQRIISDMSLFRVFVLCAATLAAQAQPQSETVVLKPARVFDGEAMHEGWLVRVRGGRIESAGEDGKGQGLNPVKIPYFLF